MVVAFIGLDLLLIFCVRFNCVQGLIIWYCYNKVLLSCIIIFGISHGWLDVVCALRLACGSLDFISASKEGRSLF
jgi:hypothetical protein